MFIDPSTPNPTDFSTFVYNQGVTTAQLPTNSEYLTWAFDQAFAQTPTIPAMPPPLYVLACYNCGFHILLRIAQDQTGETFFTAARQQYGLLNFVVGPVIASEDQGTSQNLVQPEFARELTMSSLNFLKTPWGQEYLGYVQSYGPNVVGYS